MANNKIIIIVIVATYIVKMIIAITLLLLRSQLHLSMMITTVCSTDNYGNRVIGLPQLYVFLQYTPMLGCKVTVKSMLAAIRSYTYSYLCTMHASVSYIHTYICHVCIEHKVKD